MAGDHELKVLDNIDLAVNPGEFLALLGQSGSGKSTILRCLTGLDRPDRGAQPFATGSRSKESIRDASVVFQTFALYPWLTVEQNVAVGLMSRSVAHAERDAAVDRAIELIGLGNYHSAYPRELSGGMRQRVGIARALVVEAKAAVPGRSLQRAGRPDRGKPPPGAHQPCGAAPTAASVRSSW